MNIKIILATHNKNKVNEFNKIFHTYNIFFSPISEFTNNVPKETGKTFSENAIIKAKHAGNFTKWKLPCLADDSGLSIEILSNKPGVYSASWVKKNNYSEVFKYIRKKIQEQGESMKGQKAFFNCTLALLYSPSKVKTFEGILEGTLTYPPRGDFGFGYDPIFIPNETNKTLAELKSNEKNQISHRKKAIKKLIEFIFEK